MQNAAIYEICNLANIAKLLWPDLHHIYDKIVGWQNNEVDAQTYNALLLQLTTIKPYDQYHVHALIVMFYCLTALRFSQEADVWRYVYYAIKELECIR